MRSPNASSLDEIVYRSKLAHWDERASVRVKPRRQLDAVAGCERAYFPRDLVPIADHDLVSQRGDEAVNRVLVQRLQLYLDFTTEVEQQVVNPICAAISRYRSGFRLPDAMVKDAFNIYTDESWHAQFSDDMQRQVAATTGIERIYFGAPTFVSHANHVASEGGEADGLLRTFAAVVSETLVSAILADIPRDFGIVPAVRELIADHAVDEGAHHAYFAQFLDYAWPQLSRRTQVAVGCRLPGFVRSFLDPDMGALAKVLLDAGLADDEVGQVLTDVYPPRRMAAAARAGARKTLAHLGRVGVFDIPEVAEAFARAELATSTDDEPESGA